MGEWVNGWFVAYICRSAAAAGESAPRPLEQHNSCTRSLSHAAVMGVVVVLRASERKKWGVKKKQDKMQVGK